MREKDVREMERLGGCHFTGFVIWTGAPFMLISENQSKSL